MRSWLAVLLVASCYQPAPPANAPCGPGGECPSGLVCAGGRCAVPGTVVDGAPGVDASVVDSAPGIDAPPDAPPNLSGCADGEREALIDLVAWPSIAGCAATWTDAKDLRAPRTAASCGDDLNAMCGAPVDACAPGWHMCGEAGQPTEISSQLESFDCAEAGPDATSRFVAALSHCTTVCTYTLPLPCGAMGECNEPVCCGAGCRLNHGCQAAVYSTATPIAGSTTDGCAALLGTSASGVLCCKD